MPAEESPDRPRIGWSRMVQFGLIAVLACAADLWTKWYMFSRENLRAGHVDWVVPDYAGFQLSLNAGALFGVGQGYVAVFATLSIVAAIIIPLWLFYFRAAEDRVLTWLLGFIMAGVLGNLYDRLGLHGETWFYHADRIGERAFAVRDWILLQWGPEYRWPNFNLADAYLVVAAGVLAVKVFFEPPSAPSTMSESSEPRKS